MKLNEVIKKGDQKKQRKRTFDKIISKTLRIAIGYPFVFPVIKIKEFVTNKRNEYWKRHRDTLRLRAIKEIVAYIEKDMTRNVSSYKSSEYVVYNAGFRDDINYSNAFYLHDFVGYGWYYRRKEHPISKLYFELNKNTKAPFNKMMDYDQLFLDIREYLKQKYEDVEIVDGEEPNYRGGQTYFKIKT